VTCRRLADLGQYPLSPLEIIFLELFMDIGASTSFVVEQPDGDVMHQGPLSRNIFTVPMCVLVPPPC
jgi:hypothetical protein